MKEVHKKMEPHRHRKPKPPAKRAKNPYAQRSPNFGETSVGDKPIAKSALTRDGIEAGWNTKWKHWSSFSRLDFEVLMAIAMGADTNKQLHEKLRRRRGKNVPKSTIS